MIQSSKIFLPDILKNFGHIFLGDFANAHAGVEYITFCAYLIHITSIQESLSM